MTLEKLIETKGFTQYSLAKKIKKPKQTINQIVLSKTLPSFKILLLLKKELNITYDELISSILESLYKNK